MEHISLSRRSLLIGGKFIRDDTGVSAIQYGILGGAIALGVVGGGRFLGRRVRRKFRCTGRVVDGKRIGKRCKKAGF